jgi:hypothetical protein
LGFDSCSNSQNIKYACEVFEERGGHDADQLLNMRLVFERTHLITGFLPSFGICGEKDDGRQRFE